MKSSRRRKHQEKNTQRENADPKTQKRPGATQGVNANPNTQKVPEVIQGGEPRNTAVIFRRLAVFSFLAVTTLGEAVKPKCGGIFSAVMQYGGNFRR